MAKVNIDVIRQISGDINYALAKLEKISHLHEDEFLHSEEKIDSAKYNLIVVIEGSIDICNHIVSRMGGRAPQDYADCFEVLRELSIFSSEFIDKLKSMAKFRNLIVHRYWKVDNKKVFAIINNNIADIKEYLQGIDQYLSKNIYHFT
ncbi:MAG: hypothetical protein A2Y62_09425 [Candidatus Fischerbacteria bacterium RBG_13_37_8]|uniref:DUF86 domain-containing protein n=1 Tax=Candidatus Fischerbacteria bacterium RBG_13_37_8 TaxID=1817863 RepID=A0A1F5VVT1_9BACT|nr:MAG: hypothetical protein A2Y62_09425 [Candidatus Fischerbacteria bacterium RBG_13_37_8]